MILTLIAVDILSFVPTTEHAYVHEFVHFILKNCFILFSNCTVVLIIDIQ